MPAREDNQIYPVSVSFPVYQLCGGLVLSEWNTSDLIIIILFCGSSFAEFFVDA